MFILKRKAGLLSKRAGSHFALAIALATGGAVTLGAIAEPAQAQRKKKKEKAPEAEYSDSFRAAYTPVLEMAQSEAPDQAMLRSKVPELAAALVTPDDKNAGGNLIYSIGRTLSDMPTQLRGLELMIESGKIDPAQQPSYNFQAGQIAYQLENYPSARRLVMAAIDGGYSQYGPEAIVAETYYAEDNFTAGSEYLLNALNARIAAGQPVEEQWVRRGLSVAYQNDLAAETGRFLQIFVEQFPSETSWGDAIAITLNGNSFENPAILDLLRLARRTNTFRSSAMYFEYVDAADPRRLPNEVIEVIDEGIAAGMIDAGDSYASESRAAAQTTVASDRADLPALERDARLGSAGLRTVVAAGDAFLSYNEYAKAEEFYTKALGMAGVDTSLVATRLGIAQIELGKYDAAQKTLGQVQGARQSIAGLWTLYARQEAGNVAPAAAAAPVVTSVPVEPAV